ncbi:uncharacterized protein At4g26485-like [Impatiens glandulifera]|uniref:uncharacterized protein At4g26485-like n=1 Tax=Impatiens glandulifera TaxID=253017 RepID=UPI001FB0AA21|nr:uncharacterized protein At4g26485-like [Impatiens glandulifera]
MIGHYNSSQKLLLVGEGDFSFSACLAMAFGSAVNMVATSLLSRDEVLLRHPDSYYNLKLLRSLGCLILHRVDVCSMNKHQVLKSLGFDVIIYNFPHAGHFRGLKETNARMIRKNQQLLKGYFASAKCLVKMGGEVHVTHRDDMPYKNWEVKMLAEKVGFIFIEKVEFNLKDYPSYQIKRGGDIRGDDTFSISHSFTFKFYYV